MNDVLTHRLRVDYLSIIYRKRQIDIAKVDVILNTESSARYRNNYDRSVIDKKDRDVLSHERNERERERERERGAGGEREREI
jgi:hypothetical protein